MYRFRDAQDEVMQGIFKGKLTVDYQHYRQSKGYNALCKAIEATEVMLKISPGETFLSRTLSYYRNRQSVFDDGFTTRGMAVHLFTPSDPEFLPEKEGGVVKCVIRNGKEAVGYGESICLPEDNFHESCGRDLAFNYALHDAAKTIFRSKGDLTKYDNGKVIDGHTVGNQESQGD